MKNKALMFFAVLLTLSLGAFGQRRPVSITDGPRVESTSNNSAVIAWSTTAPSSSVVRYGANGRLDRTARSPYTSGTHRVTIRGLQPGTTYSFMVDSGQAKGTGTEARSGMMTFTTRGAGYAGAQGYRNTDRDNDRDRDANVAHRDRDNDNDADRDRDNDAHDRGKHKGWHKSKHKVKDKDDKDKDKDDRR